MGDGYTNSGRPVISVYGSGPFSLHTPGGIEKGDKTSCCSMLASYHVRPLLEFANDVPGKVKTIFRSAISSLPLPEGMQGA